MSIRKVDMRNSEVTGERVCVSAHMFPDSSVDIRIIYYNYSDILEEEST